MRFFPWRVKHGLNGNSGGGKGAAWKNVADDVNSSLKPDESKMTADYAKKAMEKMINQYLEEVEPALQNAAFDSGRVTVTPTVQAALQPLVEEYKEVMREKVNL